jgi:hypothetical protein
MSRDEFHKGSYAPRLKSVLCAHPFLHEIHSRLKAFENIKDMQNLKIMKIYHCGVIRVG